MLDPVSAAIIAGGTVGAAALSKGGGGDGEITPVSTLTPGQSELLNALTRMIIPQIGTGITPYTEQRVADISGLQQQGFDIFGQAMPIAGEGITALQDAFARYNPELATQYQQMGTEALNRIMQDYDPNQITQALEPARQLGVQTFKEDIMPYIMEHYASTGSAGSGANTRALAKAAKDLSLGFSAQAAPYYFQGYESNLNRQLSAIPEAYRLGMMPTDVLNQVISGAGNLPLQLATQGIAAGGIERGITGEQLTSAQDVWTEAQPWMNPYLQFLPTALGTQAFENVYQQGSPSLASLMAPTFGSILGTYIGNKLTPAGANVTPSNSYVSPWVNEYSVTGGYGGGFY